MPNTVRIRRSAVNGAVPTTTQLALGELGLNTFNGRLFCEQDDGTATITELSAPRTYKEACRIATTGNITLSGTQTIDGVAVVAGDRVLVKNQTTGSQNGIYTVNAGSWTRTLDFDASNDISSGSLIIVREGTANSDTVWVLATNNPITLGTTSLTFTQIGGGSGGVTDGDKGDITVSSSGATWTIDNDAVTYAKLQNVTSARLLGRTTAGSGDVEELTAGIGLSLASGSLTAVAREKSVTIESPTATEKIILFFTTAALTVSQIRSVIIGGTNVTFSIRHGTDVSAAGTEVVTSGIQVTNTTTGLSTTSFNNASIAADRFVWITTSAVTGTVTQLAVTVVF